MSVFRSAVEAFTGIWGGNLTVQGDLTVNGTTTFDIPSTTSSQTITLNDGETGAGVDPVGFVGLVIDRGTETDFKWGYEESENQMKAGFVGELKTVARGNIGTKGHIPFGEVSGVVLQDHLGSDLLDDLGEPISDNTAYDRYLGESAYLYWDDLNDRLGIGTSSPSSALDVVGNITVSGTVDGINVGTDVAANTVHLTSDGKNHSDVVLNNTHRTSDGSGHADVATNSVHVAADGSDHADVATNSVHTAGNGSDHANVATNTTHISSDGKDHSDVVLNNTHRTSTGADHSYIDQAVTVAGTPTFAQLTVDTLKLDGYTLSSTSGNIQISPAGTGVGVGVGAPDGLFHIHSGSAGTISANANADDLVVEHSTSGGITVLTPSTTVGALYFGSELDNDIAGVLYNHAANDLTLRANGTNVVTVDGAAASVGIGTAAPEETLHVVGNGKFTGTGAIQLTSGSVAQRPTAAAGMIRWNSDNTEAEIYDGTNWRGVLLSSPV